MRGLLVRVNRAGATIVAAGLALYASGWFDGQVMPGIQRQAGSSFDPNGLALASSLGSVAIAGAVLLIGALAWRSRSMAVGVTYSCIGAFFAFLPVIMWRFAAQINGNPPILPRPIADELSQIFVWSSGPLNATGMVGAGMFVTGILLIGGSFRGRSASPAAETLTEPGPLPAQP